MHKALILVNGFEGILSRVAEIAKKDYGIDYFEFVYLLSMNHENSQGISGLAQEIEFIDRKARQCAVDFKNIFMTFKKLLTGIRSLKHDFYVISSEGDKQFLLLPILLILKRMPKRFIYFDLMRAEASDLTLLMLAGNIFRRLLNRNALNLFLSRISKKFRLKRVFGYPDNFMIEPTNLCNLRCQVCLTGLDKLQRKKGKIDKQVFFKIMDECGSYIRHLNMHFMGESFLHGGIID
ncbi:MAG: hypothetical protein Q8R31_03185, partial [Candidatus Omnitrophota bacterium]|nr:hypothetical protein [Candidatus Omnitrophota bacterium]